MPHDLNGTEVRVGDRVNVPCKVTAIQLSEEYCNVTLETTEEMFPSGQKLRLDLNMKQVVKE